MSDQGQVIAERIKALLDAAEAYGKACDDGEYPRLYPTAKDLKEAARKLRWARLGIEGDPRKHPASQASREEAQRRAKQRKEERKDFERWGKGK